MRTLFVAVSLGILLLGLGGCKHATDNVSIDNDPLPNMTPWWKK